MNSLKFFILFLFPCLAVINCDLSLERESGHRPLFSSVTGLCVCKYLQHILNNNNINGLNDQPNVSGTV